MKTLADNLQTLPTLLKDICRYSDSMLKHMPEDPLKTFEKHLIYSKEKVIMPTNTDEQDHNIITPNDRMNNNLTKRINRFSTQIGDDYVCRILLRFLCDVRKVNQPIKIDLKITYNLERLMIKLFQLNKNVPTLPTGTTWHKNNRLRSSSCQYKQWKL